MGCGRVPPDRGLDILGRKTSLGGGWSDPESLNLFRAELFRRELLSCGKRIGAETFTPGSARSFPIFLEIGFQGTMMRDSSRFSSGAAGNWLRRNSM